MATEMIADRLVPATNATRTPGLGLAPVRPGYHRWPEDTAPVADETTPSWAEMLVLFRLGGSSW